MFLFPWFDFCTAELTESTQQDLLDLHLLGNNKVIADMGCLLPPYGVTKKMEHLVNKVFEFIRTFEDNLSALSRQGKEEGAVKFIIFEHFRDVFEKVLSSSMCESCAVFS